MVVKINGAQHYLWRAVDQDGLCLDVLVQRRRNAKAAKKFFRKLLKGLRYVPRVLVMDKLGSYHGAGRDTTETSNSGRWPLRPGAGVSTPGSLPGNNYYPVDHQHESRPANTPSGKPDRKPAAVQHRPLDVSAVSRSAPRLIHATGHLLQHHQHDSTPSSPAS